MKLSNVTQNRNSENTTTKQFTLSKNKAIIMKLFIALALLLGTNSCSASTTRGAEKQRRELQLTVIEANNDTYNIIQDERLDVDSPGLLSNDTGAPGFTLFISSHLELGNFGGKLKVKDDGEFRYDPPNRDFVGTEQFNYTACQTANPTVCDNATVTINVLVDPNRPDANPTANDDTYTIVEGKTLTVNAADGFLDNDTTGKPSNPLYRCDRSGKTEGDLDTEEDGSFEYEAPLCFEGDDEFTYRACYEDYDFMKSDKATVTIKVTRDPSRPDVPRPDNDRYTVHEAETLTVRAGSSSGLLWNDIGGSTLYVEDYNERSGFVGALDVDEDGSFTYEAISGELGTMTFDYEVCHRNWDCVGCAEGTVTIEVTKNPNKPGSPPTSLNKNYETTVGDVLSGNIVADNTDYDSRYNVEISNVQASAGVINADDDGSFNYGNGPVGQASISYTACYVEWPDLCGSGTMIIETLSGAPDTESSSRRGVATYYEVNWVGQGQGGCGAVAPSLTLTCGAVGEVNLVSAGPSDNSSCNNNTAGALVCAAKNSGTVFVECRDGQSNSAASRQLIASLSSASVACGSNSAFTPPYTASHHMSLRTWCNSTWVDGSNTCANGLALTDPSGKQLCYGAETTLGSSAKPADITMTATGFEQCVVGAGSDIPSVQPPTLEVVGDADGEPAEGYPLQACQADCDSDDECAEGLICFHRSGNEIVPGCVGTPVDGRDYCITPP